MSYEVHTRIDDCKKSDSWLSQAVLYEYFFNSAVHECKAAAAPRQMHAKALNVFLGDRNHYLIILALNKDYSLQLQNATRGRTRRDNCNDIVEIQLGCDAT